MQYTLAAGTTSKPIEVGRGTRVTVTGGYIQSTTSTLARCLSEPGGITWTDWPAGAVAGTNDALRSFVIRAVATSACTLTITEGFNDNAADDDELWQDGGTLGLSDAAIASAANAGNGVVSVKDFGAVGDGSTDDSTALAAALSAITEYSTLYFPPGNYILNSTLTIPVDNVLVIGHATITAKAGNTTMEYMVSGTSRTNVVVSGLTLDCNQANRTTSQASRYNGAAFTSSTDCAFHNVTVKNHRGHSTVGIGLVISAGTRCKVLGCTVRDGVTGSVGGADAIYTSGTQTLIANCVALNCTDTGFVLENSNYSMISGCSSVTCSAGAAISSGTVDHCYGNVINGLTVKDYNASNTGGISIFTGSSGNLYDCEVSNVTIRTDASTYGAGPAIKINETSSGIVSGLTISGVKINGTKAQGILVNKGTDVSIVGCTVRGTVDGCVQFASGSVDGHVSGCRLTGGSFGIVTQGSVEVTAQANRLSGNTNGIYAYGTSTIISQANVVKSSGVSPYGVESGSATVRIMSGKDDSLQVGSVTSGAVGGSNTDKIPVVGKAGTVIGYIPIYAS